MQCERCGGARGGTGGGNPNMALMDDDYEFDEDAIEADEDAYYKAPAASPAAAAGAPAPAPAAMSDRAPRNPLWDMPENSTMEAARTMRVPSRPTSELAWASGPPMLNPYSMVSATAQKQQQMLREKRKMNPIDLVVIAVHYLFTRQLQLKLGRDTRMEKSNAKEISRSYRDG